MRLRRSSLFLECLLRSLPFGHVPDDARGHPPGWQFSHRNRNLDREQATVSSLPLYLQCALAENDFLGWAAICRISSLKTEKWPLGIRKLKKRRSDGLSLGMAKHRLRRRIPANDPALLVERNYSVTCRFHQIPVIGLRICKKLAITLSIGRPLDLALLQAVTMATNDENPAEILSRPS